MSDDDMMYDSGNEDPYEYSGQSGGTGSGGSNDPSVLVENKYFEAKDIAENDLKSGLKAFEEVLELEKDLEDSAKGNWGFKALKRIVKINYQLKNYEKTKETYEKLVTQYSDLLVENEKAMNNLLDFIANAPIIKELFDFTLAVLNKKGNKKACLRLELRLAKVLLQRKDFSTLEKSLERMHQDCQLPDGSDDPSKGNQLMDIYALKIAMYTERNNQRKLKELYEKALQIKGLCNPRISGIIHECGGKMHMRERNWQDANTDFFEAFKNYDDAGIRKQSYQCLKYLVLANMLSGSKINPFDEQRAKSYQNHPEIKSMIELIEAYQSNKIRDFEKILKDNEAAILGDDFIKDYIEDLMKKLRSQVLLKLIKPYTNISLKFISGELNIKPIDVENLLVELILDNQIRGQIDQIKQILLLADTKSGNFWKYRALQKWTTNLTSLEKTVFSRVN
eukprot:TRINITY_DN6910_c0_g1_i1.p1 TRINITY_DN6910_c0_g1~~TRINITY_DN6910_c0_g1_i1.p1  ORF type:complete len:460 (-),score=96.22 TRINITY_DN6910_c0_g1_i1:31-1380(-)